MTDLVLQVHICDQIVRHDILAAHAEHLLNDQRAGAGAVLAGGAVPQDRLLPGLKQKPDEPTVLRQAKLVGDEAGVHLRHVLYGRLGIRRGTDPPVGFLIPGDSRGLHFKNRQMQVFHSGDLGVGALADLL